MIRFITKRILYGFLVLAGVVTVVFLLFNVLPGDPARMLMGQRADAESLRIIKKDLGLDRPLSQQFVMYINDLSIISVHDKNPELWPLPVHNFLHLGRVLLFSLFSSVPLFPMAFR